jgi:hypothetical protein
MCHTNYRLLFQQLLLHTEIICPSTEMLTFGLVRP